MSKQFSFTGTSFATLNTSDGIEGLPPYMDSPSPCHLSAARNVRFTQEGGVRNREGYTRVVTIGSSAKVDDCAAMPLYNATFWKSGTTIYQATKDGLEAGTIYTTGVTRAATEKDFLYQHEKDIYAVNETDGLIRIAVSRLTAVNSGAGTFSLESGGGDFFSSGTVYIRGVAVTGGTLSGDNMTGATGLTGSMAIGDIVTQSNTLSSAPKGSCMADMEGAALIGKGTTIYASLPSTDQQPELFYDFTYEDGATAKRMNSPIKCIKTGLKVALIGMVDGIDVANGFQADSGALLTEPLSRVHGVPNSRCIIEMDNKFAILTNEGRILIALNGLNGFELIDDPNTKRNFDYPVSLYIKQNKDQSDNSQNFLHYNPSTKVLKAVILMTTGITEEVVCQTDIGAWSIDDSKNIRCRLNIQGQEYAGDDSTDSIHHDEFGYTDNGFPIISHLTTGRMRLGRKGVTADWLNLTYGGVLSENGQFFQRIIHNGVVEEEEIFAEDMIEAGQMIVSPTISLGEGEMGTEQVGGQGTESDVFTFTYPYEMMIDAEWVQLEWEISDEGAKAEFRFWELSGEHDASLLLNVS